jgi:uncharacterized protein
MTQMRYRTRSLIRNKVFFCCLALCLWGLLAQAQEQTASAKVPAASGENQPKDYSPYPAPELGYVTDLGDLLTLKEEERIERWLLKAEEKTDLEIVVVTINSIHDYPGASTSSIEKFARGLFDTYGIGNMPAPDGVLLLVAVKDRKARIELGAGYGRARDRDARRIMDEDILPAFREENYAAGIQNGVKGILREFGGLRVGLNWPLIGVTAAIPVVGLIAVSLFRNGKRGWGWISVGLLIVLVLVLIWIIRQTLRHMPRRRGGLGGFGGGFSGGGGATGSW